MRWLPARRLAWSAIPAMRSSRMCICRCGGAAKSSIRFPATRKAARAGDDAELSLSLWALPIRSGLAYADAMVIEAGFAGGAVSPKDAEQGAIAAPAAGSAALVFYGRLINMRKDDALRITASGPSGYAAASDVAPLDRPKAHYIAFAGKTLTGERWASGRYLGQVEELRGGKVIGRREVVFDLR
jgi:hypothetical protein